MADNKQLTEEQVALSLARQRRKAQMAQTPSKITSTSAILDREWMSIGNSSNMNHIRLLTWNLLAQTLVRRELFPTSDCLKASQRNGLLLNELLRCNPDIMCLQEVDMTEKLLPTLHAAGYQETFAAGPGKRHGCMIAYRDSLFQMTEYSMIEYDNLAMREDGEGGCKGSSRLTRNIALIGALASRKDDQQGYLVATTHLFWHPAYTYERIRQSCLLLREIRRFREKHGLHHWPCVIAGDFNFPPSDPAYAFLVGETWTPLQKHIIEESRVVHVSIDSSVGLDGTIIGKEDDEAATDPDRVITHSRAAACHDGLLSDGELSEYLKDLGPLRSIYEEGQRRLGLKDVFGSRCNDYPVEKRGYFEPEYTSYTHFWKSTLDYIFVIGQQLDVGGFMKIPHASDLGPGLPRKGVCGSDHVSLVADITNFRTENESSH